MFWSKTPAKVSIRDWNITSKHVFSTSRFFKSTVITLRGGGYDPEISWSAPPTRAHRAAAHRTAGSDELCSPVLIARPTPPRHSQVELLTRIHGARQSECGVRSRAVARRCGSSAALGNLRVPIYMSSARKSVSLTGVSIPPDPSVRLFTK